ncbi:fibroblast growth factor receptor-like 1 [Alosa alosa]|uniref:fibroblast growth factor receptor-like 1 n=1 Tax=Alosa alosa TaxID=278164 RepID=UPI0020155356|nr:fibroblast growth factor receptor-like 1 [Alosa alosa]
MAAPAYVFGQKVWLSARISPLRVESRGAFGAVLSCGPVDHDPPPLLMWTKDGRNIHSGWLRFRILQLGLRVKQVEPDDAGTYVCKATNGFGSVSVNYTLIIIDDSGSRSQGEFHDADPNSSPEVSPGKLVRPRFTQPSKIIAQRSIGRLRPRPEVCVKCQPRPDIVWLKDERPLSEQEVGVGRHRKWTLSLRALTPEHSGRYTCRVSNRAGLINATYRLEVIPDSTQSRVLSGTHPVNTTVEAGGSTSLQCKVRSDVKPVIQWLKRLDNAADGRYNSTIEVGDHRFVVLPTGEVWSRPDGSYLNKLLISRAKPDDSGMYICLGANTMGYSYRSAHLTVLPDSRQPITPVLAPPPSAVPWPVIIGVPAGVLVIFGSALLWLCQSRKPRPPAPPPCHAPKRPALRERERDREKERERERGRSEKEVLGYEDLLLLNHQKLYPKIYTDVHTHTHSHTHTDVHTHTHAHLESKVHQHQHIHFQC